VVDPGTSIHNSLGAVCSLCPGGERAVGLNNRPVLDSPAPAARCPAPKPTTTFAGPLFCCTRTEPVGPMAAHSASRASPSREAAWPLLDWLCLRRRRGAREGVPGSWLPLHWPGFQDGRHPNHTAGAGRVKPASQVSPDVSSVLATPLCHRAAAVVFICGGPKALPLALCLYANGTARHRPSSSAVHAYCRTVGHKLDHRASRVSPAPPEGV